MRIPSRPKPSMVNNHDASRMYQDECTKTNVSRRMYQDECIKTNVPSTNVSRRMYQDECIKTNVSRETVDGQQPDVSRMYQGFKSVILMEDEGCNDLDLGLTNEGSASNMINNGINYDHNYDHKHKWFSKS